MAMPLHLTELYTNIFPATKSGIIPKYVLITIAKYAWGWIQSMYTGPISSLNFTIHLKIGHTIHPAVFTANKHYRFVYQSNLYTLLFKTMRISVAAPHGPYRLRFLVRQGQRYQSVDTKDISYFFSEERFIFFKTKDNQKYLTEYRIEELEKMLDPMHFFRVNRAFLVSITAIQQVHIHHGNRLRLFLEPATEKEVVVSRERVADFRIWMGE